LDLKFDPIPRPEVALGDCRKKKLPFDRKKPASEPEPGRALLQVVNSSMNAFKLQQKLYPCCSQLLI